MKSVSFFGIAVITTIAVAEAERPLPLEVRMLACVIAGMLGGVLNSWRRHGRVALDGGTAGFIGGLIGAASNYWAQETLTAGLWAIVAAGLVGYSGPGLTTS